MVAKALNASIVIGCCMIAGCAERPSVGPTALEEYKLGTAEQSSGDTAAAIEHFQSAVKLDPSLRMANAKLADLYRSRGDYPRAATQYRLITRLDPYEESNHYYLGVCEQVLQHFRSAALSYLIALNLKPADSRAMTNLGIVFLSLNQPDAANRWLKQATITDPGSAAIWLNYGVFLESAGRFAEAETTYRRALELQSSLIVALEDLAANLIAQKKANEAVTACELLLLRTDSAVARARYGQALSLRGDDDEAARQFDLALKRDNRSFVALSAKGFFLIHLYRKSMELDESQRTQALVLWQQSLAIDANQPSVRSAIEQWKTSHLMGE